MVLAHGFVGDGLSTWSSQIEALSGEFTVVAWDAPGAGHSSQPPEWFRLPDYADCFAAFLRALGFGRVHLVGLSFGGALALATFERHPTVPGSLVLVSAYAGWAGSLASEEVEERLQFCLRLADLSPDEFASAMVPSMFSTSAPHEVVSTFGESVRTFDPAGFRAMARSSAEANLRPMLGTVNVPTLLVYGEQDVRAPLKVGEAIHASIQGSRLVVLPSVGHVCSVEAPDLVNHELFQFLRGTADLGEGDPIAEWQR